MTDQSDPNQSRPTIDDESVGVDSTQCSDAEQQANAEQPGDPAKPAPEHGGPKGLEPTRFGDWERNGRCSDF